MASQITHVVLANKLYSTYFSRLDKTAFIVGNVFPDVRKLAGFDRSLTHHESGTWADVLAERNAFQAGLKLHNCIDIARENYMQRNKLYDLFTIEANPLTAAKLFEDEVLYHKLADWKWIIEALSTIQPDELGFPATEGQLHAWHTILQRYFADPANAEVRQDYEVTIGIDHDWYAQGEAAIRQLRQQAPARQIVLGLYDDIETLLAAV